MASLNLRHPDGPAGLALLLMRLSCAAAAFPAGAHLSSSSHAEWLPAILSTILALSLATGLFTRTAAALLALALAAGLIAGRGETTLLMVACAGGAGALGLLGPGAWSIDARRYGRRVIRLEPRPPDRGSGG